MCIRDRLYASQIIEGLGREAVEFVMDKARVEKYKNETFTVNGIEQDYTLIPVEEAKPVDLVILAVKYPALKAALDCMKNSVDVYKRQSVRTSFFAKDILSLEASLHWCIVSVID